MSSEIAYDLGTVVSDWSGKMKTAPAGSYTQPRPNHPRSALPEGRASLMVSMPGVSSHIHGATSYMRPAIDHDTFGVPVGAPVKMPYRSRTKVSFGVRRRVYERDNWTCQYCGRQITPTTPNQETGRNAPVDMSSGEPVWLELDHIVPRVLGGNNSFGNLRAACSPCNRRKSDSTKSADWQLRAARAVEILTTRPSNQSTVLSAARALLGVTVEISDEGSVSVR